MRTHSYKKRRAENLRPESDFARRLRRAQKKLQGSQPELGLQELDAMSRERVTESERSRLIGMIAEYEFRRGAYERALPLYRRHSASRDPGNRDHLQYQSGAIRCLLALGRFQEAEEAARILIRDVEQAGRRFAGDLRNWEGLARRKGQVVARTRPMPAGDLAGRVSNWFIAAGDTEAARRLLAAAPACSREGRVRCGILEARLSLRAGDWAAAEKAALAALSDGGHLAASLEGWSLLLTARGKLGRKGLEEEHLRRLWSMAPSVRARAMIEVARGLRAFGDEHWKVVAGVWLRREGEAFPVEAVELRKILLAEAESRRDAAAMQEQARCLLGGRRLCPTECVSACKEWARGLLLQNRPLPLRDIRREAEAVSGSGAWASVRHAVGLACLEAGKWSEAGALFSESVTTLPAGDRQHGQAVWNLGLLAEKRGDTAEAARRFKAYFRNEHMPEKLRWAALIRALKAVPEADVETTAVLESAVDREGDAGRLLDLGRQLAGLSGGFAATAGRAVDKGERLALESFKRAAPRDAVRALCRLARAQNAVHRYNRIATLWEQEAKPRMDDLWRADLEYWEYLCYVFRALLKEDRSSEAESMALQYLKDPSTPREGFGRLALEYGVYLFCRGSRPDEGMEWFRRMEGETPFLPDCSYAYYWMALHARSRGDGAGEARALGQLRRAVGANPTMRRHRAHAIAAALLDDGLDVSRVAGRYPDWTETWVSRIRTRIEHDLAQLATAKS